MAIQATQSLSWLYVNASGQLYIVDAIAVSGLSPNQEVSSHVSPITNFTCNIDLSIITGIRNSTLNIFIPYVSIGANLNTESAVRNVISSLTMVTVTITSSAISINQEGTQTVQNSTIIIL
jgi:hypothetical protein